jgi:hypothetical protein
MATKQPSGRGRKPKSEASGRRKRPDLGPVADQLGPRLRKELEDLAGSEAKILKGLGDPDVHRQFLVDPAGALARIGVEVPPITKQRLRSMPPLPDVAGQQAFRLPDGQVVTANVRVRFTGGKKS